MVTESFVASCGLQSPADKKQYNPTPAVKDAAVAIHTLAPLPAVSQILKKGAAATNCLTISDEHVFSAQADKAIVVVYSRERGNQECIVPFQEKVTALAGTCEGTVIVLGTEGGRLMLWETCTGRLVSASAAHLQQVSSIVASADSNFIVSGSKDSTLQVWSVPALLTFGGPSESRSPLHALTSHRAPVTGLALSCITGAGAVAISASEDGTAIVWDYIRGNMLRTVLLTDAPTSLVMDPADRGFFAGYRDGSVQLVDFYDSSVDGTASEVNPIHDESARSTPMQPPPSSRWRHQSSQASPVSSTLSLALSFDGMTLLSGHANGHVMAWDVGRRGWQKSVVVMAGPVTNLHMLPVHDWPHGGEGFRRKFRVDKVIKPKFEFEGQHANGGGAGAVPGNYTFTARFTRSLDGEDEGNSITKSRNKKRRTDFEEALTCPTGFPIELLEDSIADLAAWKSQSYRNTGPGVVPDKQVQEQADVMALDVSGEENGKSAIPNREAGVPRLSLEAQNALLKEKIAALQRVQRVTFRQLDELRANRRQERTPQPPASKADTVNIKSTKDVGQSGAPETTATEDSDLLTASAADFVAAEGAEAEEEQGEAEVDDNLADLEDDPSRLENIPTID